MKESFSKFVGLNFCGHADFLEAKAYYERSSFAEQKDFLVTMIRITKKVFQEMIRLNIFDFTVARKIYARYGLTDADFEYFLTYFMKFGLYRNLLSEYEPIMEAIDISTKAKFVLLE